MEKAGSDASVEASRLKSELEAKVAECEQLKKINDEGSSALKVKEEELEKVRLTTDELRTKVAAMEKAGSDGSAETSRLQSELEAKVAECERMQSLYDEGRKALNVKEEEAENATRSLAEMNAKIVAMEKAGSDGSAEVSRLQSELEAKVAECERMRASIKKGKEALKVKEEEAENATRSLAEMNAKIVAMEKAGSDASAEVSRLQSELEAKVAIVDGHVATIKDQKEALQKAFMAARDGIQCWRTR